MYTTKDNNLLENKAIANIIGHKGHVFSQLTFRVTILRLNFDFSSEDFEITV